MKKTLIAAGIAAAVAAPAAFADVSISGAVEQAFTNVDSTTVANDQWTGTADNYIKFAASEDLGNGMTAFADITLDTDANSTKDQKVGMTGSFGTVVLGRMEDFTEGKMMSAFTLNDGSAGGGAAENGSGQSNAPRADDAIAYVSPTMNGFHFGVAGYVLPDATMSALSGATQTAGEKSGLDATDMIAVYENGPLKVAASQERINFKGGSNDQTQKTTVLLASYAMGDLKATVARHSVDDNNGVSGQDSDDNLFRLDYKMGNNAIAVVYNDDEEETNSNTTYDIWSVELTHKFSKRTSVYANWLDMDNAADDGVTVGMIHKF